jgi:hypothetical protein
MSAFGAKRMVQFDFCFRHRIWKHKRLAKQPLRALVPVFETRGVGRFYLVEMKWRTHSAYAVYVISLVADPDPTSFSNTTRS